MASVDRPVEFFFLPYLLGVHLIPMIDTARIFAARGVKATIITTPTNAQLFRSTIDRDQKLGRDIAFHAIELPTAVLDQNFHSFTSDQVNHSLFLASTKLREPLRRLLMELKPDCLISDLTFTWTVDVCNEVGIPRIMFHVYGLYPWCCEDSIRRHAPHEKVSSDSDIFSLLGFPHNVEFTVLRLPNYFRTQTEWGSFQKKLVESEGNSYGILFNSFPQLEPGYPEY